MVQLLGVGVGEARVMRVFAESSPGLEQRLGAKHKGHCHLQQLPQGKHQPPPKQLWTEQPEQRTTLGVHHDARTEQNSTHETMRGLHLSM